MISINVNGVDHQLDVEPNTPLLWVLRDHLELTGTKFGCGIAQCGACTVLNNGRPIRSCIMPVSSMDKQAITTIENIAVNNELHPVQQAWLDHDVAQCGYCQSGQIMSAVALLRDNPQPSDEDIDQAMAGNICRCGTYQLVRRAIKSAASVMHQQTSDKHD